MLPWTRSPGSGWPSWPQQRSPADSWAPRPRTRRPPATASQGVAALASRWSGAIPQRRADPDRRPAVGHAVGDADGHRELAGHGISFERGYVSNPLCCPSRASILTGQYSHSNGVYTNQNGQPHGGFRAFDDRSTVATWLDEAGYRTAMLGKYFNGYEGPYVPPGWDPWFATYVNGAFYDYLATDDGVVRTYGSDPADYGTTVLATEAVRFIESTPADTPLFLYFAPHAPHEPAMAAPGDRRAYTDLGAWRPPNYDEADVSDKPEYIRDQPRMDAVASAPDRRVPPQPVRLAARRRSRGRDDRRCPGGVRADVEHADRLHLRQRDALGRAPLGREARSLRGEHPRAVHRALRPDDRIPTWRTSAWSSTSTSRRPSPSSRARRRPGAGGEEPRSAVRWRPEAWRTDFLLEHMQKGPAGAHLLRRPPSGTSTCAT